jgi:iron complex outermembrane receptor protein
VLFARNNTLSFEEGTPDSKVNLSVDWSIPVGATNLGVNIKGTRYGEVVEPGIPSAVEVNAGIPNARDIAIHSDWLVDFAFNAKLLEDKLGFTLGVDNLFDQYPDRVPIARALPLPPPANVVNLDATNATAFSRYSPYGFNGRFVYARMSFNW